MKTIVFFNVKGGVGKTSSAVTVAHMLATVHNKRVLLIDLDPQSNTTGFYGKTGAHCTVANVLTGAGQDESGNEVSVAASDAICKTEYNNLDILPSTLLLQRTERELAANMQTPSQLKLRAALRSIKDDYDFCVIDCSPSMESLANINGLVMADYVFVPLRCDEWAVQGLDATISVVDALEDFNENIQFGGCFFVAWENRNVNKAIHEQLSGGLGDKMLPVRIRKNKSVEEMSYAKEPLLVYDKNGKATEDYLNLTKLILEKMGCLI